MDKLVCPCAATVGANLVFAPNRGDHKDRPYRGNQMDKITYDRRILEAKELLRTDEAAQILRVSKRSVYRLYENGVLDGVLVGRAVRIRSKSIKKIIKD